MHIFKIFSILLLAVFISSCKVSYDEELKVNFDGSVSIKAEFFVTDQLKSAFMGKSGFKELLQKSLLNKKGVTVKMLDFQSENKNFYVKIESDFQNYEQFNDSYAEIFSELNLIKIGKLEVKKSENAKTFSRQLTVPKVKHLDANKIVKTKSTQYLFNSSIKLKVLSNNEITSANIDGFKAGKSSFNYETSLVKIYDKKNTLTWTVSNQIAKRSSMLKYILIAISVCIVAILAYLIKTSA